MAEAQVLTLHEWEGDASVYKEKSKLVFEWPCGARYSLTPRAFEKFVEQLEVVKKLKGVSFAIAGLKGWRPGFPDADDGRWTTDDEYMRVIVNGNSFAITDEFMGEEYGTIKIADLKKVGKKTLA